MNEPREYMMASELIAALQRIVAERGDLPVAFKRGDYSAEPYSAPCVVTDWFDLGDDPPGYVEHIQVSGF